MQKKSFAKRLPRLLMAGTLLMALLLPQGSAKYIYTDATPTKIVTVTWLGMNSLAQYSASWHGHNAGAVPNSITYTVTDGVNDGWYAIIAWGGCGGWGAPGSNPAGGWGAGGCVKCIVWLDGGTYTILAGSAGDAGISSSASYGGGPGYSNVYLGGSGGGLSGVFKNGVSKANAIAVAGAGGGGASTSPGARQGAYGGSAAGSDGGCAAGIVSTVIPAVYTAGVRDTAAGETPGGSARTGVSPYTPDGAYERGAGGGLYHDHSGTLTRYQGNTPNVLNGGGHACWGQVGGEAASQSGYAGPGGDLQGGSGGVNNVGAGGGGAGYQGGGAGGSSTSAVNPTDYGLFTFGAGGGGSSYMKPSVTPTNPDYATAKASRSYQGTHYAAPNGTTQTHGFTGLNPTIFTLVNTLPVPRPAAHNSASAYGGIVVMAYLGPSDEIFNTGGGITFN